MALRRLLLLISAATALLACCAGPAAAFTPHPDSDAPQGASPSWLPSDEWVSERWLPFDETVLEAKLGMSGQQVWKYLSSTGDTLNALARQRGVSTNGLAGELLSTRGVAAGSARWKVLRSRTARVLSQAHLAAHMFGHVFHIRSLVSDPQKSFGVSPQRFDALFFDRRLTIPQIARLGGVDGAALRRRVFRAAQASGARGVRLGAMSAAENRILRARDRRGYASWASYRVPGATATAATARAFECHLPGTESD